MVSLDEGPPLAVRLGARRLEPDESARTVGQPLAQELVQITDPADPSATYPMAIHGRYVIHVSDALDPAGLERALGHERAVLVARHRRASATSSAAAQLAPLSPRDGLRGDRSAGEPRALARPAPPGLRQPRLHDLPPARPRALLSTGAQSKMSHHPERRLPWPRPRSSSSSWSLSARR